MKISSIKLYFCFSLQAILLIIFLIYLPNSIWEHLYSKSVTSKNISSSLAVAYEIEENHEMGAPTIGDTEPYTFNKTRTTGNIITLLQAIPARLVHDNKTTSVKKVNLQTTAKNISKSKEVTRQTHPARTTSQLKEPSVSLVKKTTTMLLQAKNFASQPHWKFEEEYTLSTSASETSCPVSVKIKALNSSWLKEKFLTKITIFMDDRHFSDQDWIRLGHFIPPFGWMELNYNVVKEVVSVLPRIPDQQLLLAEKGEDNFPRCVSCAVVGNGGILKGSGLGKEIDEHDYVFRVNGAVIKTFEKDVGTRTSFYGFTAFTMLSSLYLLKNYGFNKIPQDKETKYILFTEGSRDYEWLKALQQNKEISGGTLESYRLRPRDDFGHSFDFKRLLVAHPDFSRYLKNRFLRSSILNGKYWNLYRPSTGALMLLTALHLCDTVSAYGYMTQDFRKYPDHYYDKLKTNVTFYINHDFLLEKELWARLHNENIIKLYQRT